MSDDRFGFLFEHSLDAMIIADDQGRYLEVNQAACDLFGYSRQQMLQMSVSDLVTMQSPVASERYEAYLRTGRESGEFVFVRADKQVRAASYSACRIAAGQYLSVLRDVTRQKHAEEQLRQSEIRFRLLVEQSPLSVQILAPDGRTLQVNRAWEQLWGLTLDQIRDYNMLQDAQLVDKGIMPYIKRAFAGEPTTIPPVLYDPEETIPNRTKNAEPKRWTQAVMYPVKDDDGRTREVVLIHEDITEQRQAEGALRISDERFRSAIEAMREGLFIIGSEGEFLLCNQSAPQILGLTHEQMMGRTLLDPAWRIIRDEGAPFPQQEHPIIVSLRTGLAISGVVMGVYKPSGELAWIEINSAPLQRSGSDKPYGAVATIADITHRRLLYDALRQSEERYRSLVVATSQIVWSTDANGAITQQTASWGDFTGQTQQEYMGWGWLDAIHQEDRERTSQIWKEALESRTIYECEYRLRHREGVYRNMVARGVPLRDERGIVHEWVGTNTDITERVRHLQEIENLNERLRRSIQETHHRVKNNLQMISALVELQVEQDSETVPTAAMYRIGQHTQSLAAIHDLLTQQVKADPHAAFISTRAAMDRLIPLLQGTIGRRQIHYEVDEFHLPVQASTSLSLLISEIISNAIKHGRGDIEVVLTVVDNVARLEVSDDGPGFPPHFDWKAEANTGLGLIDMAGRYELRGSITYGNRSGGGARVVVTFPLPTSRLPTSH